MRVRVRTRIEAKLAVLVRITRTEKNPTEKFMAEIRGKELPKMGGYSAHTNGPGRIDDRDYPQTASVMANPATESFQFSIGIPLKASKRPGRPTLHARRQPAESDGKSKAR